MNKDTAETTLPDLSGGQEDRATGWAFRLAQALGPWSLLAMALFGGAAMELHRFGLVAGLSAALAVGSLGLLHLWALRLAQGDREGALRGLELAGALARLCPHPFFVTDFDDGCIVAAGDELCELLGMAREELVGRQSRSLVPEWRLRALEEFRAHLLADGWALQRDAPYCKSDGTTLWFDLHARLVHSGAQRLVLVSWSDVTQRRVMEESLSRQSRELQQRNVELTANNARLAQSQARHRALFKQAMHAVLIVDGATGLVRDANPRTAALVGAEVDSLVGQPFSVLAATGAPSFDEIIEQAKAPDGVTYGDTLIRRTDGNPIHVDMYASLAVAGDEEMLVITLREVSERRRMREALEKSNQELRRQRSEFERVNAQLARGSDVKSQYLADVSHEIRTPLNAINGFAELLADESFGELTEQQSTFVRDIMDAGRHLLQLINDVIDLAKVEAGKIAMEPEPAAMNRVVEQAVRVIRGSARNKSISVRVFPDEREPVAMVDDRRTKQVLFNLLTNAIRYAPEGTSVDLTVATVDEEWVKVSVHDSGVGIAPADQERIFEEFVRVGPVSDYPGGAGLGLPLSRRLVELQGGQIGVDSMPGAGSTFWFTAPIAHRPEEEQALAAPSISEVTVAAYLRTN